MEVPSSSAAPSASGPGRPSGAGGADAEVSEADSLCSEFLAQVQLRTREGYEEALRLSEKILEMEPGNAMVHEYQTLIEMFLRQMKRNVEEDIEAAEDPARTPSEVTTDEE